MVNGKLNLGLNVVPFQAVISSQNIFLAEVLNYDFGFLSPPGFGFEWYPRLGFLLPPGLGSYGTLDLSSHHYRDLGLCETLDWDSYHHQDLGLNGTLELDFLLPPGFGFEWYLVLTFRLRKVGRLCYGSVPILALPTIRLPITTLIQAPFIPPMQAPFIPPFIPPMQASIHTTDSSFHKNNTWSKNSSIGN